MSSSALHTAFTQPHLLHFPTQGRQLQLIQVEVLHCEVNLPGDRSHLPRHQQVPASKRQVTTRGSLGGASLVLMQCSACGVRTDVIRVCTSDHDELVHAPGRVSGNSHI